MNTHCLSTRAGIGRQRGSGLIESMISIVILSFGVLGLARFQINMLAQSTDAHYRLVATALAEELLAMVRVDVANAPCYTHPAQGACSSPFAAVQTKTWADKASKAIPGVTSVITSMPDATSFNVALAWSGKAFKEQRTLQVVTDVR